MDKTIEISNKFNDLLQNIIDITNDDNITQFKNNLDNTQLFVLKLIKIMTYLNYY